MEASTLPRERDVRFGSVQVTLRELSLRKIGLLGEHLAGLAGERTVLEKLGTGDVGAIAEAVAELMQTIPDRLAKVVTLVSDVPADAVLDATPRQVLELLVQVWELNDLATLFRGKVAPLAGGQTPAAPPPPGTKPES